MPEIVHDRSVYSLSEIALSIQKTLAERYPGSVWIKADMNKLNRYPQSGHCYPELVEKVDGRIVAEMRANLWRDDYDQINARFLKILKEPLKEGIGIMFCAKVTYHPLYGLALRILDIDPSYSLGELEREKLATIEALKREGVFHRNKSLPLPLLPKRIAIISVETSKGYADFMKVINENPWNYRIFHVLFPALLQGENAVGSILAQLERISRVTDHFDAVAIIRGGGGDIGLTCYNHPQLTRTVACFPIPVLTGIGHSTNETVTEMVAWKNAITPTELADFILQKFHDVAVPVEKAQALISGFAGSLLDHEKRNIRETARLLQAMTTTHLNSHSNLFRQTSGQLIHQSRQYLVLTREKHLERNAMKLGVATKNKLQVFRNSVEKSAGKLESSSRMQLKEQLTRLHQMTRLVEILDPLHVLKRGYTITKSHGRVVKSTSDAIPGTELETIFHDGTIHSIVK